jgi:hypothetical protein
MKSVIKMAFSKNEFQQMNLNDNFLQLSNRSKTFLEKSWAHDFSEYVFPSINEERFSVLFSPNPASRPNTPVNVIIGAFMLKELFGTTDEETLESILFDIRYQYALHTTSFTEQPISDRTFSRFRERLYRYEIETGIDLLKDEMLSLADVYTKFLGINVSCKRMDSIMISSNCKRMSRFELIYTCIADMVSCIYKTGEYLLIKGFEKYLDESDRNNTIYRSKPEQVQERLIQVITDADRLLTLTKQGFQDFEEYQLLERVVKEQVTRKDDVIQLADPKCISTDSLQNPSDPDATFRTKAGEKHIGYVGNFVETIDEKGAIITQFDYQKNIYSDHTFCKDVLDELGIQDNKTTLIADGAYSGMENVEKAKSLNIELITTALTGPSPDKIHADFQIDAKTREVTQCPKGYKPLYCWHDSKRDDYRLTFERSHCENCPNKNICKAKVQKFNAVVKISNNMVQRAKYLNHLNEDEYKKLANKRNGVEGIPSILRRKYQVDNIPVRGYVRSKMWFSLKIGAINISKLLKWLRIQAHLMKLSRFCFSFPYKLRKTKLLKVTYCVILGF